MKIYIYSALFSVFAYFLHIEKNIQPAIINKCIQLNKNGPFSGAIDFRGFNGFSRLYCSHVRYFVSATATTLDRKEVTPVVIYPNADLDKSLILKDNKEKVGIYC